MILFIIVKVNIKCVEINFIKMGKFVILKIFNVIEGCKGERKRDGEGENWIFKLIF